MLQALFNVCTQGGGGIPDGSYKIDITISNIASQLTIFRNLLSNYDETQLRYTCIVRAMVNNSKMASYTRGVKVRDAFVAHETRSFSSLSRIIVHVRRQRRVFVCRRIPARSRHLVFIMYICSQQRPRAIAVVAAVAALDAEDCMSHREKEPLSLSFSHRVFLICYCCDIVAARTK